VKRVIRERSVEAGAKFTNCDVWMVREIGRGALSYNPNFDGAKNSARLLLTLFIISGGRDRD
jgi:hypothetical protein